MVMQERKVNIDFSTSDISLGDKLDSLPPRSGVYQFKKSDGRTIYVGKAKNLRSRVRQYFQKSRLADPRLEAMISKISDVEVIATDSEVEALILEANLIKKFKPWYNINHKDDKSYPYIVVTNEPFPRVFVTRRIVKDGSRYFGPYTDVGTMRYALKTIRDIFRVRSCNYWIDEETIRKKKIRLCLDYHIKKCDGPCEGLISQGQYNAMTKEVEQLLKGKTAGLMKSLENEMSKLSDGLKYEEAAVVRDKLEALRVYTERQKVVALDFIDRDILAFAREDDDACGVVFKIRDGMLIGRQHFSMVGVEGKSEEEILESLFQRYYLDAEYVPKEVFLSQALTNTETLQQWLSEKRGEKSEIIVPKIGEKAKLVEMCAQNARFLLEQLRLQKMKRADYVPHSVKALQRDLRLPRPPRRIECFDISNIQGSDAVASMVSFQDGRPKKSEYRKFKIRTVVGPDDFASMREVVERRYSRVLGEQAEMPDLIMVDGGKGQLSSALEVLRGLGLTDQPVIGLAKRLEEVYVPGARDPQTIPRTSSGLRLLQQIRNEAHRFAITYHRKIRTKRTIQTELHLIEGVGKKRAKLLLEVFGSVQGVIHATESQLAEIVGEKVAGKIKGYFEEQSLNE